MFAIVLENVGMAYRSTFNVFEGWICTGRHEKLDHLTVAVFCCDVKRALAAGVDRVDDGTALEEKLGAREPTLEHFNEGPAKDLTWASIECTNTYSLVLFRTSDSVPG